MAAKQDAISVSSKQAPNLAHIWAGRKDFHIIQGCSATKTGLSNRPAKMRQWLVEDIPMTRSNPNSNSSSNNIKNALEVLAETRASYPNRNSPISKVAGRGVFAFLKGTEAKRRVENSAPGTDCRRGELTAAIVKEARNNLGG
jgi:hypothetical protein